MILHMRSTPGTGQDHDRSRVRHMHRGAPVAPAGAEVQALHMQNDASGWRASGVLEPTVRQGKAPFLDACAWHV
jgi:hypothetical protein